MANLLNSLHCLNVFGKWHLQDRFRFTGVNLKAFFPKDMTHK